MRKTYQYGHRSTKHRHVVAFVVLVCVVVLAPIAYIVYRDLMKNGSSSASGTTQIVGQVTGDGGAKKYEINEPTFTMQLPSDWKELNRVNNTVEHSITWQATKKNQNDRWLTIYIDTIPSTMAVNRMMPVTLQGSGLNVGDVSDNCATFTGGGTLNTQQAMKQKPSPAKWQGVDFICDLPNVVENHVGVGVAGGAINQVKVTGSRSGTHSYFFLYTDHDIQPNYVILSDALSTFNAK